MVSQCVFPSVAGRRVPNARAGRGTRSSRVHGSYLGFRPMSPASDGTGSGYSMSGIRVVAPTLEGTRRAARGRPRTGHRGPRRPGDPRRGSPRGYSACAVHRRSPNPRICERRPGRAGRDRPRFGCREGAEHGRSGRVSSAGRVDTPHGRDHGSLQGPATEPGGETLTTACATRRRLCVNGCGHGRMEGTCGTRHCYRSRTTSTTDRDPRGDLHAQENAETLRPGQGVSPPPPVKEHRPREVSVSMDRTTPAAYDSALAACSRTYRSGSSASRLRTREVSGRPRSSWGKCPRAIATHARTRGR